MDLRDTPDEAAFRAELRAWLDANLPEERRGGRGGAQRFDDAFGREWSRMLYDARLRRPDLAEGVRRRGRALQLPGDLLRGDGARAGARATSA